MKQNIYRTIIKYLNKECYASIHTSINYKQFAKSYERNNKSIYRFALSRLEGDTEYDKEYTREQRLKNALSYQHYQQVPNWYYTKSQSKLYEIQLKNKLKQ